MKHLKYHSLSYSILSSFIFISSPSQAQTSGGMYIPDSVLIKNAGVDCITPNTSTYNTYCSGNFTIKDTIWGYTWQACSKYNTQPGTNPASCEPYTPIITNRYYSLSPESLAQGYFSSTVESMKRDNRFTNASGYSYDCTMSYDTYGRPASYNCWVNYYTTDSEGKSYYHHHGSGFSIGVHKYPTVCPGNGTYIPGQGCTTDSYTDSAGNKYETLRNSPTSCEACPTTPIFNDVAANYGVPAAYYTPPTSKKNIQRGDPIDVGTASVIEYRNDLSFPIPFIRTYYSKRTGYSSLGQGWRHNFDKKMIISETKTSTSSYVSMLIFDQENDKNVIFSRSLASDNFTNLYADQNNYKLSIINNEYILKTPNGDTEVYNSNGYLTRIYKSNGEAFNIITDSNGNISQIINSHGQYLTFNYGTNGLISQITNSNNENVAYTYVDGQLASANINNTAPESYQYTNKFLTSIVDELGNPYASFTYDTQGRAIQNARMLGPQKIEQHDFTYSTGYINETQPNGNAAYFAATKVNYIYNVTSYSEQNKTYYLNYDTLGRINQYTDTFGGRYIYTYDAKGRVSTITRPNQSVATITWNENNNLPETITEPAFTGNKVTSFTYDEYNNVKSKTISGNDGSRTWNYTYAVGGKLLTANSPDGSSLTYNYHDNNADISVRGLLNSITNQLGQTMTFNSYDRGQPTSITSFSGITKYFSYGFKGNIVSETIGSATNTYTYNDSSDLTSVTLANGYILNINYDSAHRVSSITDNNGGSVTYTYDNTTGAVVSKSTLQDEILLSTKNSIVDKLGRVTSEYYSNPSIVTAFRYAKDNSISNITDANQINTGISKTSPTRFYSINKPGYTAYPTYDNAENMINLTINNNQVNKFEYNTFGELIKMISQDTGTNTYSTNLSAKTSTQTDNAGTIHTVQMDNGNRPISITHTNGGNVLTESVSYNSNSTVDTITDNSGETSYEYNSLNQITQKTQIINGHAFTVTYVYNDANQLISETYPSGLTVNYTYTNGLLSDIGVNSSMNVISNIKYQSMRGLPVSWNLFNSPISVTYNADDKLTFFSDSLINQSFTTDNVGNVKGITDTANNFNLSANYDSAYQITTGTINTDSFYYAYDQNLNPSLLRTNNVGNSFNYKQYTNLLNQIITPDYQYITVIRDLNGNTTSDNNGTYSYDLKNNMIGYKSKQNEIATYTFNALNQRVSKTINGVTTYFVYNENHQLIGEYDSSGNVIAEHIYFGQRPVAFSKNNQLYAVHTDYLGTPRIVTDNANAVQWKWLNTNILGANLPTVDNINYNLRFAGQYFDSESKLHYNYYRTYNPNIGRYMQSDPIGLAGGPNTYNYVGFNPLNATDPDGLIVQYLAPTVVGGVIGGIVGGGIGWFNNKNVWESAKEGAFTGMITGLGVSGAGRLVGMAFGDGAITQISANVIGSSLGEIGRQKTFDTCSDINWSNVGVSALAGGIFSPLSKPYILGKQNVTSWADEGFTPDLNPGRWVMLGGPNRWNHSFSGRLNYPINNFKQGSIDGKNLTYPTQGKWWEVGKGIFGQRNIK